jgi:hypothetical protein
MMRRMPPARMPRSASSNAGMTLPSPNVHLQVTPGVPSTQLGIENGRTAAILMLNLASVRRCIGRRRTGVSG